MTDIINCSGLSKNFGRFQALDGVDLTISEGEIFGFLGPNGAGKSTTIRCMMGFMRPTAGTIALFGYDMSRDAHLAKRRVGYLPGNVKLYKSWTGRDHIRFFEGIRGKTLFVEKLIDRLDFNPDKPFHTLSSGNKQKLGLILALMHKPDLLIMDEPTVGLDPLLQNEIYEILIEMRKQGATIFISSHNLPEVERLCDRVGLIREGKLVTVETIANLAQKKTHIVEFQTDDRVDIAALRNLKNVDKVEKNADGFTLAVNGDLNVAIQTIAKHHLKDLRIEHASLEEIFLRYYQKDKER